MRLDGEVFCGQCVERRTSTDLTKDGWKRRAVLRATELNKTHKEERAIYRDDPEVQVQPRSTRPFWLVDECGYCGKPFALSQQDLRDLRFLPDCDHKPPFADPLGITSRGMPSDEYLAMWASAKDKQLARLDQTEAWERNLLEEDFSPGWSEIWELSPCAHCGENKAVATVEHRKAGLTQCRSCAQRDNPIDPWVRVQIILRYLPTESYAARKCSCSKWELVDTDQGDKVVLSWCDQRARAELGQLARAYAKDWIFDPQVRMLLLTQLPDSEPRR